MASLGSPDPVWRQHVTVGLASRPPSRRSTPFDTITRRCPSMAATTGYPRVSRHVEMGSSHVDKATCQISTCNRRALLEHKRRARFSRGCMRRLRGATSWERTFLEACYPSDVISDSGLGQGRVCLRQDTRGKRAVASSASAKQPAALAAMHRYPSKPWAVKLSAARLAKSAGSGVDFGSTRLSKPGCRVLVACVLINNRAGSPRAG
ncbi:hypothetical protein BD413DRAFT_314375 [Trametes elegans]|nr:hypothetical protein BD413DRAFT_314375 [Trametes elegans]